MEEVSPYSIDVVFLAQLVIITIYSQCSAVKSTIRNATIRAVQTQTHTHTGVHILHSQKCTCILIFLHVTATLFVITTKEYSTIFTSCSGNSKHN